MTVEILPINISNRRQVKKFVFFPFELYRNCAEWVPPLLSDAYGTLDPSHAAYRYAQADFFLALKEDKTVGRIAAFHNDRNDQYTGRKTATFSFFDCVEDEQVSAKLFERVFEWALQRGLEEILGPRGLTNLDGSGVLVKGFEHRAALNMPYNFPYYDSFIYKAGFEKDSDSFSGYLPGNYELSKKVEAIAEKVKVRRGLWIKSFTSKAEMRGWITRVADVILRSFSLMPDFIPPSEEEIKAQADTLIAITDPRLLKLVMSGDEVVGFVVSYHDLGPALQKSGGRLFPLGWYYILREQKRANWVNINGLGLVPEHQRVGGDALLFTELAKSIKSFGFKHADIVMVNEGNFASRSDMEALGVSWYKAHRNYKKKL